MTGHRLVIFANSGRSGSTYLYKRLVETLGDTAYVAHEDIPVQVTKPRYYNRAYSEAAIQGALSDRDLGSYLDHWEEVLADRDVIETGWTCYHLLPVLYRVFGNRLKVAALHRDPWSVAMSRAQMGNYHPDTWYDDAHEVSPFDATSVAPEYTDVWAGMCPVEKCLYWWFVVYREILEFCDASPEVPWLSVSSNELFSGQAWPSIGRFIGRELPATPRSESERENTVVRFLAESFPLRPGDERKLARHTRIAEFAEGQFGYSFDEEKVSANAHRYYLTPGLLPMLRNRTRYWKHRRSVGKIVRKFWKK